MGEHADLQHQTALRSWWIQTASCAVSLTLTAGIWLAMSGPVRWFEGPLFGLLYTGSTIVCDHIFYRTEGMAGRSARLRRRGVQALTVGVAGVVAGLALSGLGLAPSFGACVLAAGIGYAVAGSLSFVAGAVMRPRWDGEGRHLV